MIIIILSISNVIISSNCWDEVACVISYDLKPHSYKAKPHNSSIIVTARNVKSSLPVLHTDYTHSSLTNTTKIINNPSVAEPLIGTSGDNFLKEQSEWPRTGMLITSDLKSGLC